MQRQTSDKNNGRGTAVTIAVLLFVFVCMYVLNMLYPIIGEDWDYSFVWVTEGMSTDRVRNIGDILVSQYNHYMIWGGRVIVHAIAQFLLLLGPGWHDLLNSLAYVLFLWTIYKISTFRGGSKPLVLALVALAMWFCLPDFTANTIWITYSAVYLWGTLIIVLFMYPFYKYYITETSGNVWLMSLVLFPFGILAGWTNENTSLALISFLVMLLLLLKYNKIPVPKWMWVGLAGVVVGCAFMLLAPGNYVRAGAAANLPEKEYPEFLFRIWRVVRNYFLYMFILDAAYLSVFYYIFKKKLSLGDNNKIKYISLLFFISAHIALIVMVASPVFPPRALFGAVTFLIIAAGLLYSYVYRATTFWRNIGLIVSVALTLYFFYDYCDKYKYLSYFNDFWNKREVYLEDQKEQGIEDVVFRDTLYFHRDFIIYDFKRFEEGWPNIPYSKYHGVRSVKVE